jgi:hypothetical protein
MNHLQLQLVTALTVPLLNQLYCPVCAAVVDQHQFQPQITTHLHVCNVLQGFLQSGLAVVTADND